MSNPPSETMTWRAHPAREQPGRTALAVATIAVITVLGVQVMGHPAWAALAIGVLLLSLNRFFFPTRFTIDGEGITASYPFSTQRLNWQQVRRFGHDEDGAFLSSRARKSFLDGFSGMHLIFGNDCSQRQRIVERINEAVSTHKEAEVNDGSAG